MKDIQLFFFVNQGESRICENREIFTLKKKILSAKEIKQDVHQSKERLFSFTGICTLLLYVVYISCYGSLKAPPINGPLWVHVLVDLPIIALLAPPNELRHCYCQPFAFLNLGKVNRPTIFFYLAVAVVGRRSRSAET